MGTIAYNYVGLVDALNDMKARGYPGDFRIRGCDDDNDEACRLQSGYDGKNIRSQSVGD
jgi:hypothetical protein